LRDLVAGAAEPQLNQKLVMGLFDSIAGQVLGNVLGGQKGGSDALGGMLSQVMGGDGSGMASVVSGAINQAGGLGGLMDKLKAGGLGDKAETWVGTGENAAVTGDEIQGALGKEVESVASGMGMDAGKLSPLLAMVLPVIIDKLTPKGAVDSANAQGAGLEQAVGGLLSGGNLQSVMGAVMKSQGGGMGGLGGLLGGLMGGGKA
jgi:uncharacterized protein YidB (DUF937 family)